MPPPRPELRPADPDDLDALVALEERVFLEDRIDRRAWGHLVRRARGRVLVAPGGPDDALRGAAVVLLPDRPRVARLYSLAVAPEARGSGIGSHLLDAVLGVARGAGKERIRLEVRADNAPAIALYRAAGFLVIEPLPGYYAEGADGVRMERTLHDVEPGAWKHLFLTA